jgi:hypothetical protein
MKNFYTVLLFLFASVSILAQAPEKMSYQAVLRDASNTLLTNQEVGMQIRILKARTAVYIETQTATTNINGLVSIVIGAGTSSDDFSAIDWSAGPYFIRTATDPSGGSSYSIIGTSQLMSVPFAMYAKTSGSATPGPQGAQGAQGTQGIQGATGASGADGVAGANGTDGTQGIQGADGAAGTNGTDGTQGIQGAAGTNGTDGTQGIQGAAGIPGVDGAAGTNGTNGAAGTNGEKGATGDQGTQGIQGAAGADGVAGTNGTNGEKGATGDQGTQGIQGETGETGETGVAGTNGTSGEKGATGESGTQGIQGATGADGVTGETGAQGDMGATGTNGEKGATGDQGTQGIQGETGTPGADGATGIPTGGTEGQVLKIVEGIPVWSDPVQFVTFYKDTDGDGYGNNDEQLIVLSGSNAPNGYVDNFTDCDDTNAIINPATVWYIDADSDGYGASNVVSCARPTDGFLLSELLGTGTDDCDDINNKINPATVWYIDADSDVYGALSVVSCARPTDGFLLSELSGTGIDDCDDTNNKINPATVWYIDADSDGYGASSVVSCARPTDGFLLSELSGTGTDDCDDDTNTTINPATVWYLDADGDNYAVSTTTQCANPGAGYTTTILPLSDCNDTDVSINPEVTEVLYDGIDNDCNTATLDDDLDGDGFVNANDCNDSDATINPATVWYLDADGDNYAISTKTQCANPGAGYTATVLPLSDCNDTDGSINPDSIEDLANGIDDDCDGEIDEINIGDLIQGGIVFWVDPEDRTQGKVCDIQDAPNRLDWDSAIAYCNELVVTRNTVLYDDWYLPSIDELNLIYDNKTAIITIALDNGGDSMPNGTYGYYCSSTEFDNGGYTVIRDFTNGNPSNHGNKAFSFNVRAVRSFCSGSAATVWYLDADGDNYAISKTTPQCANPGAGYTTTILPLSDCNDTDVSINPGVTEVLYDGIDNDCDTATLDDDLDGDGFVNANDCNDNDASVNKTTTFYVDTDKDGFGSTATADLCPATAPAGYAAVSGDCDDTNAAVHPGATEVPYDGIDNDCDGEIDEIEIGDLIQGGIVFWVDPTDNLRGKVCYYEDAPTAKNWDAAMAYCNAFQATLNTVLYGDWYLPSIDDLNLMYANKTAINTTALSNGGSSFTDYTYWSSSEYDNSGASIQSFTNGNQAHNVNKGDTGRVRAVRAFEPPTVAEVGDYRDGGIVFWVDPADNTKGKVCYTKDAPNTEGWFAAKAHCLGFEVTINTVFYDDWYLPSKDELDLMYRNKTTINATAIANGGNNFNTGSNDRFWWSSTTRAVGQYTFAWRQNFDTGDQYDYYQYPPYNVRAVRAF